MLFFLAAIRRSRRRSRSVESQVALSSAPPQLSTLRDRDETHSAVLLSRSNDIERTSLHQQQQLQTPGLAFSLLALSFGSERGSVYAPAHASADLHGSGRLVMSGKGGEEREGEV